VLAEEAEDPETLSSGRASAVCREERGAEQGLTRLTMMPRMMAICILRVKIWVRKKKSDKKGTKKPMQTPLRSE
jgi:preprotein translocase subunit SecG